MTTATAPAPRIRRGHYPVLERPAAPPSNDLAAEVAQRLAEYGPGCFIKSWEERPEGQQLIFTTRLKTFHKWRAHFMGEGLGDTDAAPWEAPPPDADTLRVYMQRVHCYSRHTRSEHITALRLYLDYWERPDLYRLVRPLRGAK